MLHDESKAGSMKRAKRTAARYDIPVFHNGRPVLVRCECEVQLPKLKDKVLGVDMDLHPPPNPVSIWQCKLVAKSMGHAMRAPLPRLRSQPKFSFTIA